MKPVLLIALGAVAALSLAGCLGADSPAPAIQSSAPPAASALPIGAALGGVLGGPVGAQMDEADRQAAYDAQVAALDSGQRRTWRGKAGLFGYIEVGSGADGAQGYCRTYSQTIYVAGHPQHGHGVGCRQPDGVWRMTS
jgi:surface antigen